MGSRGTSIHQLLKMIRQGPTIRIHAGERLPPANRCKATTTKGQQCRHAAVEQGYCVRHWNGPLIREVRGSIEVRAGRIACGAKTQSGEPCQAARLPGRERCKWHGGRSTGPRTEVGKARVARNLPTKGGEP
jgi:hypothetical protein